MSLAYSKRDITDNSVMRGGGAGRCSAGFTECDDLHQLNLLRLDCH